MNSILRNNSHLIAGLITLLALELLLLFFDSGVLIVVLWFASILWLSFWQTRKFTIKGRLPALSLLMIAGVGFLFFIDRAIWQHIFIGFFSFLLGYSFWFLGKLVKAEKPKVQFNSLSLSFIFLATASALGLKVFLQAPLTTVFSYLLIMVIFYPTHFAIARKVVHKTSLPFMNTSAGKIVSFWFAKSLRHNYLEQGLDLGIAGKLTWQKLIKLNTTRIVLTAVVLEIFLVLSALPIGIVAASAVMTLVVFVVFTLLNLNQLNQVNRALVSKYLSFGSVALLLILFTAEWS